LDNITKKRDRKVSNVDNPVQAATLSVARGQRSSGYGNTPSPSNSERSSTRYGVEGKVDTSSIPELRCPFATLRVAACTGLSMLNAFGVIEIYDK
jgi:hypothetical protein